MTYIDLLHCYSADDVTLHYVALYYIILYIISYYIILCFIILYFESRTNDNQM
jgi:hypothetical protein